ncbi:hypothetical protein [Mesorhizobium metallidurans]|nr:hypothetical protein [Mesorhizobium metallidurans]
MAASSRDFVVPNSHRRSSFRKVDDEATIRDLDYRTERQKREKPATPFGVADFKKIGLHSSGGVDTTAAAIAASLPFLTSAGFS